MEVPTNPTRESAFVWICGSFLISANEIRISREDFFGSGTETHGRCEGWEPGQHYLALLRPDCNKAVPVEKLCFLPIELALLRNVKN